MKRLLGLSVVAVFLTSVAVSAQEKTDSLYPLKVGATWTYKVSGGSIQVKVEKKEKFADKDCFRLESSSQGKPSAFEHVIVEADGVYRLGVNGLKSDAPFKFLAIPAKKGDKWSVNTKVQGQEVAGDFTVKEEDVTVPLGTYKGATLIESVTGFKIAGMDTTIQCWYVKDIGIVKSVFKFAGQDALLELEKYEAGK